MKTILAILLLPILALANAPMSVQPEFEATCRVKAKETAAETYRSCITENRTAQIEQLKKDYQQKLKSMKDEYDREIQRIGGKKAAPAPSTATMSTPDAPVIKQKRLRKPTPPPVPSEDSMDIPEPIPVEDVPAQSTL